MIKKIKQRHRQTEEMIQEVMTPSDKLQLINSHSQNYIKLSLRPAEEEMIDLVLILCTRSILLWRLK